MCFFYEGGGLDLLFKLMGGGSDALLYTRYIRLEQGTSWNQKGGELE